LVLSFATDMPAAGNGMVLAKDFHEMKTKTIQIGEYLLVLYPDDFLVIIKENPAKSSHKTPQDLSEIPQWLAYPEAIWLTEGGKTLEESVRHGDAVRTSLLNTYLAFFLYKKNRREGVANRRHSSNGHHLPFPNRRSKGILDRRMSLLIN